jgi:DNA mismatch repair protein MutS
LSDSVKEKKETPLMKQYNAIKAKHPDALLLFRVGDFYETFGEDAIKASKVLGIVLTKRKNGAAAYIELAGFPHHSVDTYLPKLVRAGYRVAICDQLEDPKATKNIVKRGVTELVTPGVSLNEQVLDQKKNNFLASIHFGRKKIGLSFLDISTGEFLIAEGDQNYIEKLVKGFYPSEVLFNKSEKKQYEELYKNEFHTFGLEDWIFSKDYALEVLLRHFKTTSLKGFGIEELDEGIIAAGAIMQYLSETRHDKLEHINSISRINRDEYVWLDQFTISNLELIHANHPTGKSLMDVMDKTITPMGSRLLKRWTILPLNNVSAIRKRLDIVAHFHQMHGLSDALKDKLSPIGDLERLISKVSVKKINPREVLYLLRALNAVPEIQDELLKSGNQDIVELANQFHNCEAIRLQIENEINPEAPVLIKKGNVINEGINSDLDDLRKIAFSGKDYLLQMQQKESEAHNIPSLKIAYNNVFGYYLEVRNTHKDKVPESWIRKQTLTQAERYITPELKEYEEKILGAESKILEIEERLFDNLLNSLSEYINQIKFNAALIAKIDCLLSFAEIAKLHKYVMPIINDDHILNIKDGRHPVIERNLPVGESYVSNNVYLDKEEQQMIMITGPNMSGKSALLRQTALIVLMAQMGSFVPADHAEIGLIDKIFTRVGASDNISSGESTFMVEMNETASILNNLSDRSLILLDEIGRGTSTYDGISIAWAISEYLHEHPQYKAKTLFATHYHELNQMTDEFPRIKNYNVAVKELKDKIIFLRKLVPGGSAHSFGIHVAKMAGMPATIVHKAKSVLKFLEKSHKRGSDKIGESEPDMQLSFFKLDDPILERIREDIEDLDINTLTPVEALMKLNEIKKILGK